MGAIEVVLVVVSELVVVVGTSEGSSDGLVVGFAVGGDDGIVDGDSLDSAMDTVVGDWLGLSDLFAIFILFRLLLLVILGLSPVLPFFWILVALAKTLSLVTRLFFEFLVLFKCLDVKVLELLGILRLSAPYTVRSCMANDSDAMQRTNVITKIFGLVYMIIMVGMMIRI